MEGSGVLDRAKWLCLAGGAVVGGVMVFTFDRFPGGGAEATRFALAYEDGGTYRIERGVDGDTAIVEGGLRLRYAGVDAPEVCRFVEDVQPFGREATDANRKLVEGRQVRLRLGQGGLDRYGRLLAGVEVQKPESGGWVDVEEELLRQGLARRMTGFGPRPNDQQLIRAEAAAKAAGLGIYGLKARSREAGSPAP
jgi:endonuclease YncB( thermonuclease family)